MNDRQQMKEHYRQIVKEKYGIENFDIEPMKTERACSMCHGTGTNETWDELRFGTATPKNYCPKCNGSGKEAQR